MKNNTIYVSLIVIALVALGAYFYPQSGSLVGAVSPNGAYNYTTSWSSINLLPTTANGTSTSILNTGASDRAVMGTYVMCTSVGTSYTFGTGVPLLSLGWTLTAATTSTANSGLGANTDYILNTSIATTTSVVYNASTTDGILGDLSRLWPVNTYLTFNFNATNTAACALGVEWLPL
jgi:hypothetical protein